MKVGLLYGAQHAALAIGLRAMLPGAEVIGFDATQFERDPAAAHGAATVLRGCDHVITEDLPARFGPLATPVLRHAIDRCHLLPPLNFSGFHPDVMGLQLDGTSLPGPTFLLHSRIAVLAYLTGHSVEEAAALYNRLVFARLGYFSAFTRERAALLQRFRAYNINLTAIFDSWAAGGCFMHAPQAPTLAVMFDLARLVCDMIGAPPDDTTLHNALSVILPATADPMARHATHPLYPELAAHLGIAAQGEYRPRQLEDGAAPSGRIAFRPAVFMAGSYDAFQKLPRAALLAAPGIMDGLAALGLPQIDAAGALAREAARTAPTDAQAFLTWHGTLLLVDAGSHMVIQRALRPDSADATELLAPHALTLDSTERPLALLGGVTVRAGSRPGTASLRRNGLWLSATPDRLAVSFAAEAVGDWECLLPISRPALEALRQLLRGGWTRPDGTRVPRATIHLEPGFQLRIGAEMLPLWNASPRRSAPGAGPGAIIVGSGSDAVILQPDPADPDAGIVLDPPHAALRPAMVGSPEAFRGESQARLRLSAMETRHLPFTLSNAHAAWALGACTLPPQLGRIRADTTLWRTTDTTVLLAPGLEGICASTAGVWKDHATLLDPAGIASAEAAALLRAPPRTAIEQPVCVFYSPNLHSYAHWVTGALLALHALQPNLPEQTSLLLPASIATSPAASAPRPFDHRGSLAALGFGDLKSVAPRELAVLARQAVFLSPADAGAMPAAILRSFRNRALALNPPLAKGTEQDFSRIFVQTRPVRRIANRAMIEAPLKAQGFHTVVVEDLTQAQQISLFGGARVVVAAHGEALANLLFCQPGTRVVELSPACAFRPDYWWIAEKLGLTYGVLPCPTHDDSFDGALKVDVPELRRLLRLLSLVQTEAVVGEGKKVESSFFLKKRSKRLS